MKQFIIVLLFIVLGLQAACAKGLNGIIYLDENSNNTEDDGEVRLAALTFTVTLDGTEVASGITDATGSYELEMDGSGTYCVVVNSNDLETSNVTRVSSLWHPVLIAKNRLIHVAQKLFNALPLQKAMAQTTENCSNDVDDDADGMVDCDDTDCASNVDCNVNDCTATNSNTDGIPDCSESLCSSASVCDSSTDSDSDNTGTVESGRACKESTGLILTLDVPVAIDYSQTVSDLNNTETHSGVVGDIFDLDITYPLNCTLKKLKFPNFIEPENTTIKTDYFTTSTHKIDLQAALDYIDAADLCDDTSPETPETDSLRTCPLSLIVIDDGIVGGGEANIQPQVVCPDDQTYDLDTFTLRKNGTNDIAITISQTDDDSDATWEAGDIMTATITITNNSSVNLTSSDFDVEVETPSAASFRDIEITTGSCSGGQTSTCSFAFNSGASVVISVEYSLPATISSATNFTTTTSLVINATDKEFTKSATITAN